MKPENGPAYISRHFKQSLQSFSIKHITGIPCNTQAQDIVKRTHHTQVTNKVTNKKEGGIHRYTAVFLI